MFKLRPIRFSALLTSLAFMALAACAPAPGQAPVGDVNTVGSVSPNAFKIFWGSENDSMTPYLAEFSQSPKGHGRQIVTTKMGSGDISLEIAKGVDTDANAFWPAARMWIQLGNDKGVVKNEHTIYTSPVVPAVTMAKAHQLGWIGRKDITWKEFFEADLSISMTNPPQSNSGATAYFKVISICAGRPPFLTRAHLDDPKVKDCVAKAIGAIDRTEGSSGFLASNCLANPFVCQAMINYEFLILDTNQRLIAQGLDPLYIIYPVDGVPVMDSTIAYVDKGNDEDKQFYDDLVEFLTQREIQRRIQAETGRRMMTLGATIDEARSPLFREDWGWSGERFVSQDPPEASVIRRALVLYRTTFRKPALTVIAADVSGSMDDNGGVGIRDLRNGLKTRFTEAAMDRYYLQSQAGDITIIVPFNGDHIPQDQLAPWTIIGDKPEDLERIRNQVDTLRADGSTNFHDTLVFALQLIHQYPLEKYSTAVILMSDGYQSPSRPVQNLLTQIDQLGLGGIPVYTIGYGDGPDEDTLKAIAKHTTGDYYRSKDLVSAIRQAVGNN